MTTSLRTSPSGGTLTAGSTDDSVKQAGPRPVRFWPVNSRTTGLKALVFSVSLGVAASAEETPNVPSANNAAEQKPLPTIVAPKLIRFVEATYPPGAAEAGLTAEVVMILRVEADGTVGNAQLRQPALPDGSPDNSETDSKTVSDTVHAEMGHRFEEAALTAARRFVFDPARVDGKVVAVRIPFRYAFTLEQAPESEQEVLVEGRLTGNVRVAGADTPLVGARITITTTTGTTTTGEVRHTTTDAQGSWVVEAVEPGLYTVEVRAEGFDAIALEEEVIAGLSTEVLYRLSPRAAGTLQVSVRGTRPPREVTRRVITRREMTRIPGTSGDALRSIQSLPGVARPPGLAGLLIIRGAAPQDTAVFVNGDEVPLIYHFGGLTSALPSELLESIDFYPGNFSSKYGRAMGGIVDVQLRSPDTQCRGPWGVETEDQRCFRGMAQVDLLDTRFVVQGPLPWDDWTFAAGGRRSWVDAWLKPVLEETGAVVTTAPVYSDYQLIAERSTSPDEKLSLRIFGSNDALEVLIENPGTQDPGATGGNIAFRTGFWRAQGVLQTQLSSRVALNALVSVGKSAISFSLGRFFFTQEAFPVQTRSEFSWKALPGFTLNAGLDFQVAPFRSTIRLPEPPRPGEASSGPFTTRPLLESVADKTFFRPAWYADATITPVRNLIVTPGARVDYSRDSGQTDFSPRITARYNLTTNAVATDGTLRRRTTLKGGAGIFHQPPQPQETNEIFGTPGLRTNRATHLSVGIEREFNDQVELSVEGFYKQLDQLVSRRPGPSGSFDYANEGSGDVLGAEMLLKYKPDDHFFGWVAYTLSRSRRRDTPDKALRPFQFDQTHILTVLGSYKLGNGWEMGARFRLVSGALDTPVPGTPGLSALYAADTGSYTPLQAAPFSSRLPLFHQLDLRVEKNWQFETFRLMTFLDILNSYNNAARESFLYNFDFSQSTYQQGLPLIPSLGLRGEF